MNRLKALNTRLLINRSIGTKTKRSKKLYNETVVYNDTIDATKTIIKKSLVPRHKIPLDDLVFGITTITNITTVITITIIITIITIITIVIILIITVNKGNIFLIICLR